MANHPLKEWRSILVAVFILGIIAGANFWGNVSADSHGAGAGADGPGRSAEARTVHPPQNTADRTVIQVEGGAVDVTGGVSIGENVPGASPGTPSQPVPNFSAINTPVWVSSQGPAQIVDDLIIYGLTEVKGGLINNGGVAPPPGGGGGGAPPAPTSELTIAPASGQPTGRNILQSAVWDLPIASIQLSSTGADVTVNTIKITFDGTASPTNFNALKLYDGANLLGDTITTFINNKATVTGFTLTIPASGPSKTLTLHAFMGGTAAAANSTFRFGIIDPLDITSSDDDPVGTAMGNFFTVTAPPPPQPDLIVEYRGNIIDPPNPQAGANMIFTGEVINIGPATSAASSTSGGIDINNDGTFDIILVKTPTAELPSTQRTAKVWQNVWTATTGTHRVQICADAGGTVTESNENNNCASQTFTVAAVPTPTLAVAIAADTPPAQSVQAGTTETTTTKFTLTAANGDVQVTDIKITRSGTGTDADLLNVKLFDGTAQLGNTATLSGGKTTFSGLNLTVANGATKTLSIKTDVKGSAVASTTFALGVAATTDITATTASGAATISGSTPAAPGNTFTVVAASQTLTLTRANIPAANSALPTGSNVTLLEFDAQMNTGTVSMSRLYMVPTTGRSGRITNLKLINTSTSPETILDPITDDASVRGHSDAYVFIPETSPSASTGTPIPTPLVIGTTSIRLKVTGTVTCGNGSVEDYIVEHADDVFLVNPPANIVKQTLLFAAVSRTATACPPPAAPTVTTMCSGGNSAVTVAWTNPSGKGAQGVNIDLDQVNTSTDAFLDKAGSNDFLNTDNISASTTSAIVPAAATPLTYYDMASGTKGSQSIPLTPGAKYFARIYYRAANEHSQLASFTATACVAGGAAAGADGAAAGTGGARSTPSVRRVPGTVRNSILNFDNETFPYSSAAEQSEPVTLFGAFIPQANAGWFAETANAQALPDSAAARDPVYIFDDLYVFGNGPNGPEPGNLFVEGGIVTKGNSNIGMVEGLTQFNGDVRMLAGTLTVAPQLDVTGDLTVSNNVNVSGNLTVSNNVNITGNVTAASVGAFYRTESSSNVYSGNNVSAFASCESGDILVSCSGDSELPTGSAYKYYGAKANITQCVARGGRYSTANTNTITVNVQGVCFSPNGLPAGQTAVPTPP